MAVKKKNTDILKLIRKTAAQTHKNRLKKNGGTKAGGKTPAAKPKTRSGAGSTKQRGATANKTTKTTKAAKVYDKRTEQNRGTTLKKNNAVKSNASRIKTAGSEMTEQNRQTRRYEPKKSTISTPKPKQNKGNVRSNAEAVRGLNDASKELDKVKNEAKKYKTRNQADLLAAVNRYELRQNTPSNYGQVNKHIDEMNKAKNIKPFYTGQSPMPSLEAGNKQIKKNMADGIKAIQEKTKEIADPTQENWLRESTKELQGKKIGDNEKYDKATATSTLSDAYNLMKKKNPNMDDADIYGYLLRFSKEQGGSYGEEFEKQAQAKYEKADQEREIRKYVEAFDGDVEKAVAALNYDLNSQTASEATQKARKGTESYLFDIANELEQSGNLEGADAVRMLSRKFQDGTPTTNFGGKVMQATSSGIGGGVAGIGTMASKAVAGTAVGDFVGIDENTQGQFEQAVRTYGQQQQTAKNGAGKVASVVLDLANVAGMQVPALLTGGVGGMAMMGLGAAGQKYVQAKDEGASEGQALASALATGLFEGALFKLPLNAVKGLKGMPKNVVNEEVLNALKNSTLGKTLLAKAGKTAAAEGLEEGLTSIASDLADEIIYSDEIEKAGGFANWVKENGANWLYEAGIGALFGAGVGVPAGVNYYNQGTAYMASLQGLMDRIGEQTARNDAATDAVADSMKNNAQTEDTANAIQNAANALKDMNNQARNNAVQNAVQNGQQMVAEQSVQQSVQEQPNVVQDTNAEPKTLIEAVDNVLNGKSVSNKFIKNIIRNQEARNIIEQKTGIDLGNTMSEGRNAINGYIQSMQEQNVQQAQPAQQMQQQVQQVQPAPQPQQAGDLGNAGTTTVNYEAIKQNPPQNPPAENTGITEYEQDLVDRIVNKGFVADGDIEDIADVHPAVIDELSRITGLDIQTEDDVRALMSGGISVDATPESSMEIPTDITSELNTELLADNAPEPNIEGRESKMEAVNEGYAAETAKNFNKKYNIPARAVTAEDGSDLNFKGYEQGGEVTLNADEIQSRTEAVSTLAHEATHVVQDTDEGKAIQDMALEFYRDGDTAKTDEQIYQEVLGEDLSLYMGKEKTELAARFIENLANPNGTVEGDYLAQRSADILLKGDRNAFQKVFDYFKDLVARFKAKRTLTAEEKVQFDLANNALNNLQTALDNAKANGIDKGRNADDINYSRTRKFVESVANSENTDLFDNDFQGSIKQQIAEGKFEYKPVSNAKTLSKARAKVDFSDGLETAAVRAIEGLNKKISNTNIAAAELVLAKANAEKNGEIAEKMVAELAVAGTEAGRAVQALSMISRLSKEGQLIYAQRMVDKINNNRGRHGRKDTVSAKEQADIDRLQSEIDRLTKENGETGEKLRSAGAVIKELESQNNVFDENGNVREDITTDGGKSDAITSKDITKLESDLTNAQKELDAKRAERNALRKKLKGLERKIQTANNKQDKVVTKIRDLREQVKQAEKAYDIAESRLNNLRAERDYLKKNYRSLTAKTKTANRNIYKIWWKVHSYNEAMGQAVEEYNKATEQLGKYRDNKKLIEEYQKQIQNINGKLSIPQEIVDRMLNAQTQAEIDEATVDLAEFISENTNASIWEKLDTVRYTAMLGNPKTHIRNIVGNEMMAVGRGVNNVLSGLSQDILIRDKSQKTATLKRATKDQKAIARKIYADKDIQSALFSGGKYGLDLELMKNRKAFSDKNIFGKAMNNVSDANFWLLEFEDGINMKRAFVKHLSMFMAARDITALEKGSAEYQEAVKYATEQGMRACFREPSEIADALNRLEKTNVLTRIVVGGNVPFKKTPINLGKRAVEFSPAGVVKGFKKLNDRAKALENDGETDITAGEVVNCFTEAATGTAIMALGAILAAKGVLKLTAGDDDENKNVTAFQKMLGHQNFSLEIGGYSIGMSWSGPVGIALFTGASAYQAMNKDNDEDFDVLGMVDAMGSMLDPMAEMSVLSGVVDLFSNNYNDGGKLIGSLMFKTFGSYVSQITNPTLLRNIANTIDQTVRDTYVPKDSSLPKQLAKKLMYIANGTPFLSVKSQPKIDLWGNEVTRGENLPWRILQNFIIPGTVNKIESSAVENELERLYKQTGEVGIIPTTPDANIVYDGIDYIMSEEEYTAYKKNYGQSMYAEYARLIGRDEYKNADDKTKLEMLRLAKEYASEYSKNKYLATKGVQYDVKSWVKTVFNADNKISLEDAIVWKATKNAYDSSKEKESNESSDQNKDLLKMKEISDKGFDIPQYFDAESKVKSFNAKDENGNTVSGLKKKRVKEYLRNADIDDKLKDYLWNELGYTGGWR